MWELRYGEKAVKQLGKLDPPQRRAIQGWMSKNVDGCENPRNHGHALVGSKRGLWRYRVGKYRVICDIRDPELLVLAIEDEHRASVYKRG